MALMRIAQPCTATDVSSGRAGLSEIFQIELDTEGVPTGRLCDPRRLTA